MVDWEKNWRGNGVVAPVLFIVSYIFYGRQPDIGASAGKLASFYDGDSTRILISVVIYGFAVLCLLWFAAAVASVLRDAGKGGWATAATAASAAIGAIYLTLVSVRAALAYAIAGSAGDQATSALNAVNWVLMSMAWFPVAMLIMAGSFGLWRAGIFSTRNFEAGVAAMVLVLLGTTTWANDGFWAPDGAYARWAPTLAMLAWISAVSVFLVRRYSAVTTPERAAVAAP